MAVSTPKFPKHLQFPTITNSRKHLTCFFSFPYRDKHFTQKTAAPIPAFCLCYLLSHSTRLSLKFGNEERRCVMQPHPFLAVGRGRKGQSLHIPMSPHTMRTHQWVAFIPPRLWGVWSKLSHLPGMQHRAGVSGITRVHCCMMEGSGPIHVPGVTEQCWTRTLKVYGGTELSLAICSTIFTQAKLLVIYSSVERGPKLQPRYNVHTQLFSLELWIKCHHASQQGKIFE